MISLPPHSSALRCPSRDRSSQTCEAHARISKSTSAVSLEKPHGQPSRLFCARGLLEAAVRTRALVVRGDLLPGAPHWLAARHTRRRKISDVAPLLTHGQGIELGAAPASDSFSVNRRERPASLPCYPSLYVVARLPPAGDESWRRSVIEQMTPRTKSPGHGESNGPGQVVGRNGNELTTEHFRSM
jgi:hypothetical protein